MNTLLLGVDEAGRGPLAGPVAVGVVAVSADFDVQNYFPDAADSKMLSEKKRDDIFERLVRMQAEGALQFAVTFSSSLYIDTYGIAPAVRRAVFEGVRKVAPDPQHVRILLDGSLRAPEEYVQETIIRGDQTQPLISLASIAAKVSRDKLMRLKAEEFPVYGFEIHKGYGTKSHRAALVKHGPCDLHRKSFKLT